jgi:hypothetical protein
MSEFFSHYPKFSYNITGQRGPTQLKIAVNIMNRTKLKTVLLDDIVQFEPYSILENERPDIVAEKVYGDVKFTWLIFVMNEIHDPIWDWPLGTREFISYIQGKYGSVRESETRIHHYERILRARVERKGIKDPIPEYRIKCDYTTWLSLSVDTRDTISSYVWETQQNEAKREIRLIKPEFASMIMSEHTNKLL